MLHHQFKPQRCLLLLQQTSCKLCLSLPASSWITGVLDKQTRLSLRGRILARSDSFNTMSCWRLSHAGSCGHSSSCQSDHEWHEAQAGTHSDQTPEASTAHLQDRLKRHLYCGVTYPMTVTFCSSQSEHWGQLNVREHAMDSTPEEEKNRAAHDYRSPDTCRRGDLSRRSLMKIKSMRPCPQRDSWLK